MTPPAFGHLPSFALGDAHIMRRIDS
jgi:hypothetical protein